jgi:hypothetical protein
MIKASNIISYRTNFSVAAVVALCVTGLWFWLTWRYDFDLADEGYYWYGSQRVFRGEVPLRDFMSYDIGRYYWAAAFMHLMGDDGIFAARVSAAVYQAFGVLLGVFICLLALQREGTVRWLFALLVACIFTIWVKPYYKVYDHATSIAIVAMLVLMLKTTKPAAWLFAGLILGIAAMIGRNHGVYGFIASVFVVSVLLIKAPSRKAVASLYGYLIFGVFIGFSPTLIMMLAIDGFAAAFMDSIVEIFKYGATNIAKAVPWPWTVKVREIGFFMSVSEIGIGSGFLFLLAFPLVGILVLAFSRFNLSSDTRKVFVAAIAAAIPYAHYSFSRPDLVHLALGIFPALIGLLAAGGLVTVKGVRPLLLAFGLLAFSLITVPKAYLLHNLLKENYVINENSGEQLWLKQVTSEKLQLITKELQGLSSGSVSFLALPNMPSIHAIFRSRMPIWEIYSLIPRDKDFEAQDIRRLESSLPEFVLLSDHDLDGNPEFRYSRMHPLTYGWLTSKYEISDSIEKFGIDIYALKH